MMANEITVVGSSMIDLVSYTNKFPEPGETITGKSFQMSYGGKGANQAVAASKLGSKVAFISKLGKDFYGTKYHEELRRLKINISHVTMEDNVSTGIATIIVNKEGENLIVLVPGANSYMNETDVIKAEHLISSSKLLICQLETPDVAAITAMEIAHKHSVPIILNTAPARHNLNDKLLRLPTYICLNETEAALITGLQVQSEEDFISVTKKLVSIGCQNVILTLGGKGVRFLEGHGDVQTIDCPQTPVIDTTGAGDGFIGALGHYLTKSEHSCLTIQEKIRRSCILASYSVTKKGTQTSYLVKEDLNEGLFQSN